MEPKVMTLTQTKLQLNFFIGMPDQLDKLRMRTCYSNEDLIGTILQKKVLMRTMRTQREALSNL